MRPMPATLALALLGALMVALSSWGSSSPAASGVFGIVVSNPGGRIIHLLELPRFRGQFCASHR